MKFARLEGRNQDAITSKPMRCHCYKMENDFISCKKMLSRIFRVRYRIIGFYSYRYLSLVVLNYFCYSTEWKAYE